MTTLYEGAYAKINLTLDVLGKRPDGYHDLSSVMQTISLRDDIEIDVGTGKPWSLQCDKDFVPLDETNLAWKAAKVFFDAIHKYYDLSKLNIIGIADKRFTGHEESQSYLGYKVYEPCELKELKPDYVLVATKFYIGIIEDLHYNLLKNTKIKIKPLVKKDFVTLLKEALK